MGEHIPDLNLPVPIRVRSPKMRQRVRRISPERTFAARLSGVNGKPSKVTSSGTLPFPTIRGRRSDGNLGRVRKTASGWPLALPDTAPRPHPRGHTTGRNRHSIGWVWSQPIRPPDQPPFPRGQTSGEVWSQPIRPPDQPQTTPQRSPALRTTASWVRPSPAWMQRTWQRTAFRSGSHTPASPTRQRSPARNGSFRSSDSSGQGAWHGRPSPGPCPHGCGDPRSARPSPRWRGPAWSGILRL
jgi:hypothetical protein